MRLEDQISEIGNRMVSCRNNCAGINRNQEEGILPRCLFLEIANRQKGRGIVVVGSNPGRSSNDEQKYYIQRGHTYEHVVAYWNEKLREHNPYYAKLRNLINKFNIFGPILWTEVAKCESIRNVKHLSLQTIRTCTSLYLQGELNSIPKDWPLIAAGRDAFFALAYQFPDRKVLGVPHPTGSRGNFQRDFDTLTPEKYQIITNLLEKLRPEAAWLPDEFKIMRVDNGSFT